VNVNDLQIKALQQTELQGIDVDNSLSEQFLNDLLKNRIT